jgi:4-hydroxy-tetrahydrodipicolinate synthase
MELNEDGLRENVRYLKNHDINVIVPCGQTGELFSLTTNEIKRVIEIVAEEKGDFLLIPGIPPGIKIAIELVKYAEDVGSDAVLLLAPNTATSEEGLYSYYKELARSINIGMMLFIQGNLESILKRNNSFIIDLIEIENVIAFKYENEDFWTLGKLMNLTQNKVAWICGPNFSARVTECYFRLCCKGLTDGISNFAPQLPITLFNSAMNQDWKEFKKIEEKLAQISELRSKAGSTAFIKAALDIMGLSGGPMRPPLLPLNEKYKKNVEELLKRLKIT